MWSPLSTPLRAASSPPAAPGTMQRGALAERTRPHPRQPGARRALSPRGPRRQRRKECALPTYGAPGDLRLLGEVVPGSPERPLPLGVSSRPQRTTQRGDGPLRGMPFSPILHSAIPGSRGSPGCLALLTYSSPAWFAVEAWAGTLS